MFNSKKQSEVVTSEIISDGTLIEKLASGVIVVHNETTIKQPIKEKVYHKILPYKLCWKELKQLQKWMEPGSYSNDGFLTKREKLLTVVEKDRATLSKHGVSYDLIADRLDEIIEALNNTPFSEKNAEGNYEITVHNIPYHIKVVAYMGWQECPFESLKAYQDCKQGRGDSDYHITNQNDNRTVFLSQLHPHLIRYHHFSRETQHID